MANSCSVARGDYVGPSLCAWLQVLACLGASERFALLDHMSVGEAMHLIQVSQPLMPASCDPHLQSLFTACSPQWSRYSHQGGLQRVKTPTRALPFWPQNWSPAKQKDLLGSMQAHTAAEVTVQLLLHGSHKWVYRPFQPLHPRPTNTMLLHADDRQPAPADAADGGSVEAPAEPGEALETSLDDILEEEVDAEEARASNMSATSGSAGNDWNCERLCCIQIDREVSRMLRLAEM